MQETHSIFEYPDGQRALYLDGSLSDRVVEEIVDRKVNRLVVVSYAPWKTSKISVLHGSINELWFQSPEIPLKLAEGFGDLRSLHLDRAAEAFNFAQFSRLKECELAHQKVIPPSLAGCKKLTRFALNSSKLVDLTDITTLLALEKLVLGEVNVPSLKPVGELRGLRHLGVTRFREVDLTFLSALVALEACFLALAPKLCTFNGIEALSSLNDLSIASCPKVANLNPLAHLKNLRRLCIENCGSLESVRPLLGLKRLSKLLLWENTTILDGDLRCTLGLQSLKELSFKDRKGYNLTLAEAKAALANH